MEKQAFKTMLHAKQRELNQRRISKDEIAIERNAETLEEVQRTAEREIVLASLTQNWITSADVMQALGRIDEGTYGTCLECDEPISDRRLMAIPWAKLCLHCQEQADRLNIEERDDFRMAA